MKEKRQKQDQIFRQSYSSLKNQISEVIKEDPNDSMVSDTKRRESESKRKESDFIEVEVKEINNDPIIELNTNK